MDTRTGQINQFNQWIMITDKNAIPGSLEDTHAALIGMFSAFSDEGINVMPFKDSWTAAQVADHIIKSNKSIAQALGLEGKTGERKPDTRAPELRDMFLDFTARMKSPDFILPGPGPYIQDALVTGLKMSVVQLKEAAQKVDLTESISHPAFGEITKLELLYFVIYHTQRHIHQLQHIYCIVEQKQYKLLSFLFRQPVFLY